MKKWMNNGKNTAIEMVWRIPEIFWARNLYVNA